MKFVTLDSLVEAGSVQLGRGKIISKKDLSNNPGSYPVYSSAKMNDGKFGEYGLYMFDEELITWSVDGGGNLFYRPKHKFSVTNVGGTLRILDNSLLDYKYLYYVLVFLHSKINFDWVKKAHPSVIRKIYKDIPLMPIDEQKRIVAILDQAFADIDKARALTEQNLKNARELFDSYLQQVFNQRGEGWHEVTLGEVTGGVFTGPFGSLLHKKDYIENGIPLVNPAHITSSGIEPDNNKTVSKETAERLSSYVMRQGDVVIGRRGEMGRCAVVSSLEDGFLCGTGSFFIKSSDQIDGGYLVRYLRSASCVARLEKIAGGAVMPNLSNTDLSNFKLVIPSVPQQVEILDLIDKLSIAIDQVISVYMKKLSGLDELKKSVLQKAFSGELTKDKQEAA